VGNEPCMLSTPRPCQCTAELHILWSRPCFQKLLNQWFQDFLSFFSRVLQLLNLVEPTGLCFSPELLFTTYKEESSINLYLYLFRSLFAFMFSIVLLRAKRRTLYLFSLLLENIYYYTKSIYVKSHNTVHEHSLTKN
jgi:hypothetical protein